MGGYWSGMKRGNDRHTLKGDRPRPLEAPLVFLGRLRVLDSAVSRLTCLTDRSSGRVNAVLRGEPLGHPAHPALTDLPIGFWTSAMVLDLLGGRQGAGGSEAAARRLVGWGVLTAVPTVATGVVDVPTLPPERQRVAVVHAVVNLLATAGYAWSWQLRRRGRRLDGIVVGCAAGALASAGGWMGGWLAQAGRNKA